MQPARTLKAKGVTVIRDSVSQSVTDFSSIVTKVPGDTDVVFIPWQQPPEAQTFAQQMAEQGKKAKVFGSDGTNDPSKFHFAGALRVQLRPGHHRHPGRQGARRRLAEGESGPEGRQLRPADLRRHADRDAGAQGGLRPRTAARSPVLPCSHRCPKVKIKQWILGGSWGGFSKTHDPVGAKFYIFQIQSNGSYKLVG